jgi:hypothetical protein
MEFIIRLLGLDSKARGFLVGYRTYIGLLFLLCLHLGPVLIALGTALVQLSAAIGLLQQFMAGSVGLVAFAGEFRDKLGLIPATLADVKPDLAWCASAIVAAYWKASQDRKHAQVIATLVGPQQPATPEVKA